MFPLAVGLAIWAACSLTFMVGMGIGSGIFVLIAIWQLRKERELFRELRSSGLALATLAFWLAAFVSMIVSALYPPLGIPPPRFTEWQKIHYFLLPFLGAAALLRSSGKELRFERHLFWRPYFWMASFVSLVGIFQFWAWYFLPESWLEGRFFRKMTLYDTAPVYHAQGLMFFHLSFASAMGFVASYAWARVFWPLRDDSKKERVQWALLSAISTLALFFTFSRIAWVAVAVMFLTLAFLRSRRLLIAAFLAVIVIPPILWFSSASMRSRWVSGATTLYERKEVWTGAFTMFRERPLTGVGFGKTGYYSKDFIEHAGLKADFTSHAHNNVLDTLAGTGIIGLLGWLAWWGVLWCYGWRAFKRSPVEERWLPAACLVAFVVFQVNGLTQVNFFDAKSQHSLMLWASILLALAMRTHRESSGANFNGQNK